MIEKLRTIYNDYPSQFWLLMAASLVDMVGGVLIFPFFSLYFTEKFDVGLAQVGIIYALWAFSGILGQALGGALTDRAGRKLMVIAGLIFSALTSLALALVTDFGLVYITAAVGGLFSSSAGPARQAMIADLLREDQLTEGYSISRVIGNVAFAIGPAIGGLLASVSYVLLFFIDAATSIITAIIIATFLLETRSQSAAQKTSRQSLAQVFRGYFQVLRDRILVVVLLLAGIVFPVYWQWYFSVPVFMRDAHSMPPYFYGSLMSMAGIIVVVVQFPLTRWLRPYPPLTLMVAGSLLFALGFGMFGFVMGYSMFMLAFAIITFGEMIFLPTQQAIVARLAPEEMRGRYMAVSGIAFSLPNIFRPALGGYLLDKFDPNWLWYLAGIVCTVGAVGYCALHNRLPDDGPLSSQ
ncbi:MAG: MFS transporter [Chloroflexi bacterium]|nr:MFS transporter [Chloroflexota bacterium]